jgi:hypothetical protein
MNNPGKGASTDYQAAVRLADCMRGSIDSTQKYVDWLYVRARDLIHNTIQWPAVEALARELVQKRELSGYHVRRIYHRATSPDL